MATKFETCINVIARESGEAISHAQAKSLVQRIMDEVERTKKDDFANSEARIAEIGKKIIEQDKLLAAIHQRNSYLTVLAERRIKEYTRNFQTPGQGLRAFMNGGNKVTKNARNSVFYQETAIKHKYIGRLLDNLEKAGVKDDFKSGDLDKQVFQELWQLNREDGKPGISGSPKAKDLAQIINDIHLEMIDRENRAGAFVRPLEGYVMRQSHDPDAIRRAGGIGYSEGSNEKSFKAWSEFILPLLDQQKTFEGVEDPAAFLRSAHQGILSGVHDRPTVGNVDVNSSFQTAGALAKKVSSPRLLHFKDADAAFEYNKTFGQHDLKSSVLGSIMGRAKSTAMMENFGPNPMMTFERIVHDMKLQARGHAQDVAHLASLNDWRVEASFRELMGYNQSPSNPSLARMGASVRSLTNMSKLGGSTITSVADKAFFHSEMTYQGIKGLDAMGKSLLATVEGRVKGERHSMLNLMGAALDGFIGNVANRFSVHDNKAGLLMRLQQKFFDLNGMNWWNDVHKGAASELMSAYLAEHAELPTEKLPPELARTLSLYGIEGKTWDFIRNNGVKEVEGRNYLTPDALYSVENSAFKPLLKEKDMQPTANNIARMRDEIDTKLRTYFADRVDIAVPTPGNDERVYAHWNTQAGTPMGEAVRMLMMFKQMPITVLRKVMAREVYGQGSDTILKWLQNDRTGNFRMIQLIAMATAGGYLSGLIKDTLKGRTPKDLSNPKTIEDAMMRGGGLGIYGDFLFNEYDRSYRSGLSTAAGPVVGQLDNVADIYSKIKQGESISDETGKLLLNNTPFINLFYIRPVLDYLVLWHLQEMTNPGSLSRSERSVERNNGQGFFVRPSEVVNR